MLDGASDGYVLTSDSAGNASWGELSYPPLPEVIKVGGVEFTTDTSNTTILKASASQTDDLTITLPRNSPTPRQVLSAISYSGELTWTDAVSPDNPLLVTQQVINVKQNPGTGEFYTIRAALNSIHDASSIKPYLVMISPGVYIEEDLVIPEFVHVRGLDEGSVVVQAPNPSTTHIFKAQKNTSLNMITIRGPTLTGTAGVFCDAKGLFDVKYVTVILTDIGFLFETGNTTLHQSCIVRDITSAQNSNSAFTVRSTDASSIHITLFNFEFNHTDTGITPYVVIIDGIHARLDILNASIKRDGLIPYGNAITVRNGGHVNASNVQINNFVTGFYAGSDGGSPILHLNSIDISNTTTFVHIEEPNTRGHFFGNIENRLLFEISNESKFIVGNTNNQIVNVAEIGGDFTTINEAVEFVSSKTPSLERQWIIIVGPGIFITSNPLNIPSFVQIKGMGYNNTIIERELDTEDLFIINGHNITLSECTLKGGGGGGGGSEKALINFHGASQIDVRSASVLIDNIKLMDAETLINIDNTNGQVFITILRSILLNPNLDVRTGIKISQTTTNNRIFAILNNCQVELSSKPTPINQFTAIETFGLYGGDLINVDIGNLLMYQLGAVASDAIGIRVENTNLYIMGNTITNFKTGIEIKPSTLYTEILGSSIIYTGNTNDLVIGTNTARGAISGKLSISKIDVTTAPDHSIAITAEDIGSLSLTGKLKIGADVSTITDILPGIEATTCIGLISGGGLTFTGGLGIQIEPGEGYVTRGTKNDAPIFIEWSTPVSTNLPPNATRYISLIADTPASIQLTENYPDMYNSILIGRVTSGSNNIVLKEHIPISGLHVASLIDRTLRDSLGPIVSSGLIVYASDTFHLNCTNGIYFYGTNIYKPNGGVNILFTPFYIDGITVEWVNDSPTNTLTAENVQRYNSGDLGGFTSLSPNEWVKHALYAVNDGEHEQYMFVYGQESFSSVIDAENGNLPLPPTFFGENIVTIAGLILSWESTDWEVIQDVRPVIAFKGTSKSATNTHGNLLGLLEDDHTQYLLVNGTRQMSGPLNTGSFPITSGLINGVNITDMSSRFQPGGADAIPTSTAVNITALTNSEGVSTSLARADHQHAHGVQTNATLHAIATPSANGFMSGVDKTKLDASTFLSTNNTLMTRDGEGGTFVKKITVDTNGELRLSSTNAFYVSMRAPGTLASNFNIILPQDTGSNGYVLTTNGSGVTSWAASESGFANPMTTTGDMIYCDSTNTTTRFPIGKRGQFLGTADTGIGGVIPQWQDVGTSLDPTKSLTSIFLDDFLFNPEKTWTVNDPMHVYSYNTTIGNSFGIAAITTGGGGSTTNSFGVISGSLSLRGGIGSMSIKMRVLFPQISQTGNTSEVMFGVTDGAANINIGCGAVFYIDGTIDNTVRLCTAASGLRTAQTSLPLKTINVNVWYKAEIIVTVNEFTGEWTQIDFLWDGVNIGTITTNLPNAASQPFEPFMYIRKKTGQSSHIMLVDYYYMEYKFISVR